MFFRLLFKIGLLFSIILSIFSQSAAAQSPEEIETLRLYYKEDELVISATRNLKPISQVAENLTIIDAEEIEAMNAHSIAEILNHVPGLFLRDYTRDFGATSMISIQGSEPRYVQVMLDGMSLNLISEGHAETNSIPVGIIDRIEIIKGPASSSWGSSLGGIINIITKPSGTTEQPTGTVKASYGERNTGDYSAQVSGLTGPLGYYIYAGYQESDGLRSTRNFESSQLFSKFNLHASENFNIGLTIGYSKPENNFVLMNSDLLFPSESETFFIAATFDASLSPDLDINLSVRRFAQKNTLNFYSLGLGITAVNSLEFLQGNIADEETSGASGKLVWTQGIHTAVIGIDAEWANLDQTFHEGEQIQQFYGLPAKAVFRSSIDKFALYANDTIVFDNWSIIPGIRYDYNNIIGDFLSPSFGITRNFWKNSTFRASISRGFSLPPLSWISGGGLFLEPNSSLKPEKIWSYQAGIESSFFRYFWIKGTVFYHDVDDEIITKITDTAKEVKINGGSSQRQGVEFELQTISYYNFSMSAGIAYTSIKSSQEIESRNQYSYNVGIKYDDKRNWKVQLLGNYIYWDIHDTLLQADYDDWIWDMTLSRKVFTERQFAPELFFNIHNLFNGNQFIRADLENPKRWIEAGIKIAF